jgi:YaiO family outer membrane protein
MSPHTRRELLLTGIASLLLFLLPMSVMGQNESWPSPTPAPIWYAGMQYGLNAFDVHYRPMHQATAYAAVRMSRGTGFIKFTSARRFERNGGQMEAELYPVFSGGYGFINYAYGETPVFPLHRLALEAFFGLPASFEASIGARYYNFRSESVTLMTGSLNLYSGMWVFMLRPFVGVRASRPSFSSTITSRYYLSDAEEFVFARCGAGFTPDERWIISGPGTATPTIAFLESQTLGIGGQKLMLPRLLLHATLDATRQEVAFAPGTYTLEGAFALGVRLQL